MPIPDNQIVLVRWRTNGALLKNGMANPRSPGDEDAVPWGQIKGVVATGRCKLKSARAKVPVIGGRDVH